MGNKFGQMENEIHAFEKRKHERFMKFREDMREDV